MSQGEKSFCGFPFPSMAACYLPDCISSACGDTAVSGKNVLEAVWGK